MSSQPQLQIFNPIIDTESHFPLFPLLPQEIRLKIWRYSLQRQRIIRLRIESLTEQRYIEKDEGIESTNQAEHCRIYREGERYCALVNGYQVLSKFLRVNSETREAALEFYRVHLPCRFPTESWDAIKDGTMQPKCRITKPGVFYFNPEYDILQLTASRYSGLQDNVVDFLIHLKTTYDPRGIGLLNWALNVDDFHGWFKNLSELHPSDLEPGAKSAFAETLTNLQEVLFVEESWIGRQTVRWWSGIPTSDTIYNRSLPILTMAPIFERPRPDPRPIAQDLKRVYVGQNDAREMMLHWQYELKRWGISPGALQTKYQFYLACKPFGEENQIYDRPFAETWLQEQEDEWTGAYRDRPPKSPSLFDNIKWPVGAEQEKYRNEDLEKAVRPAFGFWLFPMEALGTVPKDGHLDPKELRFENLEVQQLRDLSGHWPELALSSLI